jgi:uncharacterized protein involved in exopolysaccharide biosynthesis
MQPTRADIGGDRPPGEESTLLDVAVPLARHALKLILASLVAGLIALGTTYLMQSIYTSRTVFLPPQQPQSAAAAAMAQLGALSGLLGGGAPGIKSPAEQYVSLLQSTTVVDRLIDEFGLMKAYEAEFRDEARRRFARNARVSLGKKDGLITVEVDDPDPRRAAAMANRHVDELRRLTVQLVLTEAQQRRAFFEEQLKKTRDDLAAAQTALQGSGFNPGALKAEPRAAAESYARLRAEATAAEVRLLTLRRNLAETTPEVQQAQAMLSALRGQLARSESPVDVNGGPDYVGKFREFKYQETLFDLFSRQYELARLDESREGSLIQVVDVAQPAERRSWPRRTMIAATVTGLTLLLLSSTVVLTHFWRRAAAAPGNATKFAELRAAVSRKSR